MKVTGPGGAAVPVVSDGSAARTSPPLLGLYQVTIDGRTEARVAAPSEREVDLRPRRLSPALATRRGGDSHASIDVSPGIAMALLFLVTLELLFRVRAGRKAATA